MTDELRPPFMAAVTQRLGRSALVRRFSSGVGWTFIGHVGWRCLSMVSTIVVARLLGPKLFGGFGMVNSTVAAFAVFAGFRLGSTATKYVAQYRDSDPVRAGRILKLVTTVGLATCAIAATVFACAAPWLARVSLQRPELTTPLMVGALVLFITVMWHVMEFVLAGFEAFRSVALINVARGILTPAVCIPLAYAYGLVGVFIGLSIVGAVALALSLVALRRQKVAYGIPLDISFRDAFSEHGVLWRFALPGFLAGLMVTPALWVCRAMLIRQAGGDEQLGLFTAANQWRALVLFLPSILGRVILPILAQSHAGGDTIEFRRAAQGNFRAMIAIALPISVGMIGFAEVLAAVFGKDFAGSETILPVLTLSVFLFCMSAAAQKVFDGAGRRWITVPMSVVWAGVCITTAYLLTPTLGAVGLAWALLAGYAAMVAMQIVVIELVIVRGFITGSIALYLFSAVVLTLTCVAREYLPQWPAYGATAALLVVALWPGVALVRGRSATATPIDEAAGER